MSGFLLGRARTLATLVVLALVVLLAVRWGLSQASKPFPSLKSGADALCTDRSVAAGDPVTPEIVTVSVLNAGGTDGLSARTLDQLTADGFARGRTGNSPTGVEVRSVEIWAANPKDPAVRLLRTFLGKDVVVKDQPTQAPGINVVVGDRFGGVVPGRDEVKARDDATICGP